MRTSEALIRRCVSEDLRYKSYKMKKRPITDSQGQGETIEALSKTSQQTQTSSAAQHDLVLL